MATFKSMETKVDFPAMERELLRWRRERKIVGRYHQRNDSSGR